VIEGGLEDLPPFTSAAARFGVAACVMTLLAHLLAAREGGAAPSFRLAFVLGSTNFAASYGIVYWSETKLPSGLVAVLWASYPLIQAILGHHLLANERLAPRQWLGFVVGFAGVASLFATDLEAIGVGAVGAGAVLLSSPIVTAIGTTYVKKHGAGTSSLRLNRDGMWIGAIGLALAAAVGERGEPVAWTRGAILSVAYLALLGTVVTFGLYFWLLRHAAANKLAVIAYVTPAIALLLGVSLRDEPLTAFTLGGLALILAGVFLVHRQR
jgi:drug/metabolite transporter (DMT)-like permease